MRATWPQYVTLECDSCGKSWAADRRTGAYVCSLDMVGINTEYLRDDTAAAIAREYDEAIADPRDQVEPHSLLDLMDEGTGL